MTQSDEIYGFGPFRLDGSTRTLTRDGEPVILTAKAFDTLLVLLRHRERVVDKDELVKQVWPDTFVSDDSLTHSISVLRRALGDDSAQPVYIVTIPRRGYRFNPPVVVEHTTPGAGETTLPGAPADVDGPRPFVRGHGSSDVATPVVSPTMRWGIALGATAAAALALAFRFAPSTTPVGLALDRTVRFVQEAPAGHLVASGAVVSPDGRHLAFIARQRDTGRAHLWVRSLDTSQARVLQGTEGAFRPFWSPASDALGFFADGHLKKVGLNDQLPQTLADVGYRPSGGSWSTSSVILFSDRQSQLFQVSDSGGQKSAVTTLRQGKEIAHQAPFFLPDGRRFLYFALGPGPDTSGTYLGSLDSTDTVKLLDASCSSVTFAEPGFLLYVRDGNVMAQRFDAARQRVDGAPQAIASTRTETTVELRVGAVSTSRNGILTFGGDSSVPQLTWYTRDGRSQGRIQSQWPLHNPTISPDDRYVAADSTGSSMAIWLVDVERGTPTRLGEGVLPLWGPRGSDIVFTSRKGSTADLVHRSFAGSASDESLLLRTPEMKIGGNWTHDSRFIVFTRSAPGTKLDLWKLSVSDRTAVPFLETPFNEMHAQVSPDGRSIAYASDESGAWEVYVQAFPDGGAKRPISMHGGAEPYWRRDGRELYYLAPDGTLMAVPVKSDDTFTAGRPVPLFRARIPADIITFRNHYAPAGDGQRFLVDAADDHEPITVVVNWTALLAER
jgi:DNA-binding winged helix-turn-helix (wHTH) protein/Tol biopolymer transport system component